MEIKYDNIVKDVLVSHDEIVEISKRLGKQISEDYKDKNLVIIGMLVGGMPFMMELIKYITIPVELDFIQAKSYEGTCSTNVVTFKKDANSMTSATALLRNFSKSFRTSCVLYTPGAASMQ